MAAAVAAEALSRRARSALHQRQATRVTRSGPGRSAQKERPRLRRPDPVFRGVHPHQRPDDGPGVHDGQAVRNLLGQHQDPQGQGGRDLPDLPAVRWGNRRWGKVVVKEPRSTLQVSPRSVTAGDTVTVSRWLPPAPGSECATGVTLLSNAFVHTHDFADMPAIGAAVKPDGTFAVTTRIPAPRRPGPTTSPAAAAGGTSGPRRPWWSGPRRHRGPPPPPRRPPRR